MYQHLESATSTEDLRHNCSEHLDLRVRNKGQSTAYAYQCVICGEFIGQEISKKKIPIVPPAADTELLEAFHKRFKELDETSPSTTASNRRTTKEKDELIRQALFKALPDSEDPVADIQNYLLRQRDSKIDNHFYSDWQDESELARWFHETFSEYFDIYPEVSGKGELYDQSKQPRIDFIIQAKWPLIKEGFTDGYIGVEVKHLDPRTGHRFHGKASKGVFQALSYWYGGAEWNAPCREEPIKLEAVLIFSNLSFKDEKERLYNTLDKHYQKVWPSYLSIASHANVGELQIERYKNKLTRWQMDFGGGIYFTFQEQTSFRDRMYRLGVKSVIGKRRLGHIT